MSSVDAYTSARSSPLAPAVVPQTPSWTPLALAAVLAAIAWGLVAGPKLLALLGPLPAIYGRICVLSVAGAAVIALTVMLPRTNAATKIGVSAMVAVMVLFAGAKNWLTPEAPNYFEVVAAAEIYGFAFVFVQAVLTAVWSFWILWTCIWLVDSVGHKPRRLDATPFLGAALCGFGTLMAAIGHFGSSGNPTAPWSVPLVSPNKLAQVGEFGLHRMEWAMLVVATIPLLWRAGWLGHSMLRKVLG